MVRSYMRHGPTQAFGVICSPTANSAFDGKLAFVAGWEDVLVWDVKRGEMVSMWHSPSLTSPITQLVAAPLGTTTSSTSPKTFAVSYTDGSIRLWSYDTSAPEVEAAEMVTFNGHKKSVTTLAFDNDGSRLASGGTEGEIIIWDRVAEVGLFRLKGHRGAVTAIHFIPHPNLPLTAHPGFLVSTSRDTYLKLWDLSTQHCIQTVVTGRGEVCSCAVTVEETYGGQIEGDEIRGRWVIVTGSGDGEGRMWSMEKSTLTRGIREDASGALANIVKSLCNLPLPASPQPILQSTFHPYLPLLFLQTADRSITICRLRSVEEIRTKRTRRKKREKEKVTKRGLVDHDGESEDDIGAIGWEERLVILCTVRANAKIKSFAFSPYEADTAKGGIPLLLALSNNSIETYLIPYSHELSGKWKPDTPPEPSKTHSIELPGHRQDVRTISVSSDDQVIASAAQGTLKIWNVRTTACLRTVEGGYAICSTFLPGDRHVVIGTKSGELLLYDIAASALLSTYQAHTGPIWGIHVRPDGRGMVSGSADKDVKFWDFEMREEGEGERVVSRLGVETVSRTKQLALVHVRTLKMTDDVLAVKYSPDGRFLAVSLLDSTVKVFFHDTLKFFLSLYGHKLPALALDISSDSKLMITCSADKNVKIWGLDFGDCHKSIFAHDDSVMQVAFEKDTHCFWTVGKDRLVKYWDGDRFELIQKLAGHHGEIWALAVSHRGTFVVTGSHDKSIRIWEKTDEPLFLEEEREREIEALFDANIADNLNSGYEREKGDEIEAVQKQTSETLMAGEKIMEALEVADGDREAFRQWEEEKERSPDAPRPTRNPLLMAGGDLGADEHVLQTIQKIPAASMEDSLLVLPFRQVVSLLGYLDQWARKNRDITLTSRLLAFLLRTHSSQLIANRTLRPTLLTLRSHLRDALSQQRELMGYNIAALRFLKGRWEGDKLAGMLMEEEWDEAKVKEKMQNSRGTRKRVRVV